ncbi:hypothetical protein [Priestia aryabhattai]
MTFMQLILPVLKNSVGLFLMLIAIFGFVAFLIPNYQVRYGKTTIKVTIGIAAGFLLALITVLYTALVGA